MVILALKINVLMSNDKVINRNSVLDTDEKLSIESQRYFNARKTKIMA